MDDRYVKAVLTVIAVCLVWMSLGGASVLSVVGAQQAAGEVVIVGWRDVNGRVWSLPAHRSDPGPLGNESLRVAFERAVRTGGPLPVE
jgi:hypothetical protein